MYYALKSLNDDTDYIVAEKVKATEQNNPYYCPCNSCKCRFGFRSFNSNKKKNCFFKLPSSKHTDSCFVPYIRSEEGNKYDYETKSLSPEDLLKKLETPTKNKSTSEHQEKDSIIAKELKPISTIRQLYYVCASNEPQAELNETIKVIDIFAGRNTDFLYTKYITGIKLVECRFANRYKSETNTLFFLYPYNNNCLTLTVRVDDDAIFKKLRSQLWQFDNPVIIYAKWDNSHCTIKRAKQIVPLK